jgi:NADH-quinone oxidoreductase subunit J
VPQPTLTQLEPTLAGVIGPALFWLFALLTVGGAWMVVLTSNIVRMAVYLLITLGGAAGLYFILAVELIAAIQLIVYAGGTLILIVFGIMLTSRDPASRLALDAAEARGALAISVLLAVLLILAVLSGPMPQTTPPGPQGPDQVRQVGQALLGEYLVPFQVAGVVLLVVMIGAAYMARQRLPHQPSPPQNPGPGSPVANADEEAAGSRRPSDAEPS